MEGLQRLSMLIWPIWENRPWLFVDRGPSLRIPAVRAAAEPAKASAIPMANPSGSSDA